MPEAKGSLKKRLWLKMAAVVVLTAGLLYLLDPEPHYKGRRLSHWLLILEEGERPESEHENARQAFKVSGERALPLLVSRIKSDEPSKFDRFMLWVKGKVPWSDSHDFSDPNERSFRRWQLGQAFSLLGEHARPAKAEIEQLLTNKDCGYLAAYCLVSIGDNARPEVSRALSSTNSSIKENMVEAVGRASAGTIRMTNALEILLPLLHDPDPRVRRFVLGQIAWLHICPEKSVPALCGALSDTDSRNRAEAIRALNFFPADGTAALPQLRLLLSDNDAGVRSAAESMIRDLERPRRHPLY